MQETPILTALAQHVKNSRLPLHVPGHKQGKFLPTEISHWLGVAAKIDLTEVAGLDNLHHPTDCILASQQLAADYYQSDTCFYSVNGSTAGVMAAIMGTVRPGQKVLFVNSFHQSAWRALVLSDAIPVFVFESFRRDLQMGVLAPLDLVRQRIEETDNIGAVYITSPTYPGYIAPIQEIAQMVHAAGLPLIVDEAHGAHLGISVDVPPHSVTCGADIVIHSVHKMLPGLTQTAWVHCTGPRVQTDAIGEALRLLQTSSPSYLLMASLDAVQAWLHSSESGVMAHRGMSALAPVRGAHERTAPGLLFDPFRHWIPTGSLALSQRIQKAFEKKGIFVEYADYLGVLAIFGLGVTETDVSKYLEVLLSLDLPQSVDASDSTGVLAEWLSSRESAQANIVMSPREVFHREATWISIESSLGRIAAGEVTPYPPGIPLVYPGQVIGPELRDLLLDVSTSAYDVHGLDSTGRIRVVEA